MKLEIETKDRIALIRINESELTSVCSPELKTELLKLVSEGYIFIIINLKSVIYVDSSGLSSLLFGKRQVSAQEGDIKLCCLSDSVSKMIEIAQLNRIFKIFDTEEDAVNDVNQ